MISIVRHHYGCPVDSHALATETESRRGTSCFVCPHLHGKGFYPRKLTNGVWVWRTMNFDSNARNHGIAANLPQATPPAMRFGSKSEREARRRGVELPGDWSTIGSFEP